MSTIQLETAQVLITGGSDGIGKALARRFLARGATVLVTGRNAARLSEAKVQLPGLRTFQSDVSSADQREQLAAYVHEAMPQLDVVIQNAGIQRRRPLAEDHAPWAERQAEIDALLAGPVHLNHLLVPLMLRHGKPSLIVNVSSGGAYVPQPFAPVYSACKAAIHSYTVNLRLALARTSCRVVELIPPAVATNLAGTGQAHGAPLEEFADAVFEGISSGKADDVGFGTTASAKFEAAKEAYRNMFEELSQRFPTQGYPSEG